MQSLRRLTITSVSSALNRSAIRSFNSLSSSKIIYSQPKQQFTTPLFNSSLSSFNSIRNYSSNTKEMSLRIRKPAPKFTGQAVVNGEFKEISLDQFKGKYVYLFFYPLDFTFVCPTEIIAFSQAADEFRQNGCELIGCSIDSVFSHLAWINTPRKEGGLGGINLPLLSDVTHQISKDYGVYIEEDGHTIRGSFLIDGNGILKHVTMNDNPVGRNVQEALRLLKAFQFTDKHGEVCPANWQENGKTMVPNPKDSKSYFNEVNK